MHYKIKFKQMFQHTKNETIPALKILDGDD